MKDGYYLSTYVHIGEMQHDLNLVVRHEQNVSLWYKESNKIKLIHYWELERVTGQKKCGTSFYSVGQAKDFINALLKQYQLTMDDMIQVWGTSELQTCTDYDSMNEYPDICYHSIAHIFSTILSDTKKFYNENIIAFAVDGSPDCAVDTHAQYKNYYSGCVVQKGKVEIFPVFSPGQFWIQAKRRYKMLEGTLMALGSASSSELFMELDDVKLLKDQECYRKSSYEQLDKIEEAVNNLTEKDEGVLFNGFDPRFTIDENKTSMFVKKLHYMSLKVMETNIDDILSKYNMQSENTYLAMSGGYALNCPANSHLMQKYRFKGFIAPPCVSDCGISMGIALYAFYKKMKNIEFSLDHAYYGNRDDDFESIFGNKNYKVFIKKCSGPDLRKVVKDLEAAPVVWFDGRAEIGPRALGGRSILADPRKLLSKAMLNKTKQRQWWRPVAPVVLEEDLEEWFEDAYPSPYMLHTFRIRKDKIALIPSIAHLDSSARVQTINNKTNPNLYKVIKEFKSETGIPLLCNTSLNDLGEPIIDKIEEALNFALRKEINVAYINTKRIELHNFDDYKVYAPLKRPFQIKELDYEKSEAQKIKRNPYKIPDAYLSMKYRLPHLRDQYDITVESDAKELYTELRLLLDTEYDNYLGFKQT